jgi:plastocyanin
MTLRAPLICSAAAAVLLVAGCAASETKQQTQPLNIDVTIAQGKVTPTDEQLKAKVGQQIVFKVNSDADDELHVHSSPEHEFEVKSGAGQTFDFSTTVPGRVDVELHHLNKTVATIQVEP